MKWTCCGITLVLVIRVGVIHLLVIVYVGHVACGPGPCVQINTFKWACPLPRHMCHTGWSSSSGQKLGRVALAHPRTITGWIRKKLVPVNDLQTSKYISCVQCGFCVQSYDVVEILLDSRPGVRVSGDAVVRKLQSGLYFDRHERLWVVKVLSRYLMMNSRRLWMFFYIIHYNRQKLLYMKWSLHIFNTQHWDVHYYSGLPSPQPSILSQQSHCFIGL